MEYQTFSNGGLLLTRFDAADGHVWLTELGNMVCGNAGADSGPWRARGIAVVDTDAGFFEGGLLQGEIRKQTDAGLEIVLTLGDSGLELHSAWHLDSENGIWSRFDRLVNTGDATITVFRCQARFVFAPGQYEFYSQGSRWVAENQGVWQDLEHGAFSMTCEGGRTAQAVTPFACLRDRDSHQGVAFHIVPRSNYDITIAAPMNSGGAGQYFARVELGLAGGRLRLPLEPGAAFDLPEILIMPLGTAEPYTAAASLHRFLVDRETPEIQRPSPMLYNTWFLNHEHISFETLRPQLEAAREIGCEVFAVDAGWYGQGEGFWYIQAGDWREKQDAAFQGRMNEFAEEVRAAGLGFGLWMEPERVNPELPVVEDNPDWFVRCGNGYCYPRLDLPEPYAWLKSEITRLVETYSLAWLKLDFNFDLDPDPTGTELYDYYTSWYRLVDEIRAAWPDMFLEGCASGGMRLDIRALDAFHCHFLSDTVNAYDVLRINEGALLRLPPGRIGKWAALRPLAPLTVSVGTLPNALMPGQGCWDNPVSVDADFAIRVAMSGALGYSGDIAGLPDNIRGRLADHAAWYKSHRQQIVRSAGHLLTAPRPVQERGGWSVQQLADPVSGGHLLFVYRLDDAAPKRVFHPASLAPERRYRVMDMDASFEPFEMPGEALMTQGITVQLDARNRAAVIEITPVP